MDIPQALATISASQHLRWPGSDEHRERSAALNAALAVLGGKLSEASTPEELLAACKAGLNRILAGDVDVWCWDRCADRILTGDVEDLHLYGPRDHRGLTQGRAAKSGISLAPVRRGRPKKKAGVRSGWGGRNERWEDEEWDD